VCNGEFNHPNRQSYSEFIFPRPFHFTLLKRTAYHKNKRDNNVILQAGRWKYLKSQVPFMLIPKNKICTTKYLLYILAFVSVVFSGCKKKIVHCEDSMYEIPFGLAFVGFNAASVDTLIRVSYSPGSNFSDPVKTDTFFTLTPVLNNDTFYSAIAGNRYIECKIYLPGETDTFFIKDVKYPEPRKWDEPENCLSARATTASPYELQLNGTVMQPDWHSLQSYNIYLKK
jgi:hypothetical protein